MQDKTRVAVYCRVSTNMDTQDGSYETQLSHFKEYVTEHPDMELVDVYGDHGKSGRYIKGRDEFQRMLEDCNAGKIDLILTKSISRFARNMLDCVSTIRELTELGVVVRFEKEGFETSGMYSELMLSILATIAQEESVSLGQNKRVADSHRNKMGCPTYQASYGYKRKRKDYRWYVVEEEANRVRLAFMLACQGNDYSTIRNALQELEDIEETGKVWKQTPVVYMLTNVSYIGSVLTNKCFTTEINGKSRCMKNHGDVDQYYIENHHEPLVSRAIFDVVQELVERRLLYTKRTRYTEDDLDLLDRAKKLAAQEYGTEAV